MEMNLQFFGGHGGSSGMSGGSGVIDRGAKERTIETIYREARGYSSGYYKSDILEATDAGNGELAFVYATPAERDKTAKSNRTQYLTYKLKAGAEDGDVFGVNWNKVKSVSGQTYGLRTTLKDKGFKWDGKEKKWRL